MSRVFVLGSTGMLGSMMVFHLSRVSDVSLGVLPVFDASCPFDSAWLGDVGPGDFVLNCIGVINRFCRDDDAVGVERAVAVNSAFPYALNREIARRGARLIQIATDCVFSGSIGGYVESSGFGPTDAYGMSKRLGEVFGASVLNVRCSIIGFERLGRRYSLLEWFLSQTPGSFVDGFSHHLWNGVTTLQFARLCEMLVTSQGLFERCVGISSVHHFVPNEVWSKFELLCLFRKVFDHDVFVRCVGEDESKIDRTLSTEFSVIGSAFGSESLEHAMVDLALERERFYEFFPLREFV